MGESACGTRRAQKGQDCRLLEGERGLLIASPKDRPGGVATRAAVREEFYFAMHFDRAGFFNDFLGVFSRAHR